MQLEHPEFREIQRRVRKNDCEIQKTGNSAGSSRFDRSSRYEMEAAHMKCQQYGLDNANPVFGKFPRIPKDDHSQNS